MNAADIINRDEIICDSSISFYNLYKNKKQV